MATIRFNPLTYSKKLEESGLDKNISETIAQEQADIISNILNNEMATKSDINGLKKDVSLIQNELKMMEQRLLTRLGSIMLAGIGILGFILKH